MEVSRGEYWEEKRAEIYILSSGFQDQVGEDSQRLEPSGKNGGSTARQPRKANLGKGGSEGSVVIISFHGYRGNLVSSISLLSCTLSLNYFSQSTSFFMYKGLKL